MPIPIDFIESSIALLIVFLSKLLFQMDKTAATTGLATKNTESIASARTMRSDTHPDAHCISSRVKKFKRVPSTDAKLPAKQLEGSIASNQRR
jgi:hypothetical protein